MRTVRRIYFYLVALVSLEVVVWGVISLARTLADQGPGGAADLLATGLSLAAVGTPIFLIHWLAAQRDARRDEEERSSRVRALFLYAARLAALIPLVQNILALLSRLLLDAFGASGAQAYIGSGQTISDNLAAIAVNAAAFAYFEYVLREQTQAHPHPALAEVRRLYRWVWVLYGLGLTVAGVQQLLSLIGFFPQGITNGPAVWLANGLALVLVGTPVWLLVWMPLRAQSGQPDEQSSLLRLGMLFALSLAGAAAALISAAQLLAGGLVWMLGQPQTVQGFLSAQLTPLSILPPAAAVWAYYSRQLRSELAAQPDRELRAGAVRLYTHLFSLGGCLTVFFGTWGLASQLVELSLASGAGLGPLRQALGGGLALLAVGLPLWLRNWPQAQAEAAASTPSGDLARRSVVRKGYLYLLLFGSVGGGMAAAGMLLYLLLRQALGIDNPSFVLTAVQRAQTLALVLIWLGYHWSVLRRDTLAAQRSLEERQARYPVIIFCRGEEQFAAPLAELLARQAPRLPVMVHTLGEQPFADSLSMAQAVVLPAALAADPPEALRLWLSEFHGQRLAVPLPDARWQWVGGHTRRAPELVRETAAAVRSLAEGQPVRSSPPANAWTVVSYVLAALFVLVLLFVLLSLVLNM
jgi:hypothetical protein